MQPNDAHQPADGYVIAYREPTTVTKRTAWRPLALIACLLALLAFLLGAAGTSMTYHRPLLMAGPATQGAVLILVSLGLALLAIVLAFAGVASSRFRRGWVALFLSVLALASCIAMPMLFPDTGLGNIH